MILGVLFVLASITYGTTDVPNAKILGRVVVYQAEDFESYAEMYSLLYPHDGSSPLRLPLDTIGQLVTGMHVEVHGYVNSTANATKADPVKRKTIVPSLVKVLELIGEGLT